MLLGRNMNLSKSLIKFISKVLELQEKVPDNLKLSLDILVRTIETGNCMGAVERAYWIIRGIEHYVNNKVVDKAVLDQAKELAKMIVDACGG